MCWVVYDVLDIVFVYVGKDEVVVLLVVVG